MSRVLKCVASIVCCQLAGFVGSVSTRTSVDTWYATLEKPFFNPPAWIFAPVWIVLYVLMGIALFLVWDMGWTMPRVRHAMFVFLLQLLINAVWSPVFFGLQNLLLSVFVIIALWLAIVWTIREFASLSKTAALILVPYFCWVSFALVLNITIFFLNR